MYIRNLFGLSVHVFRLEGPTQHVARLRMFACMLRHVCVCVQDCLLFTLVSIIIYKDYLQIESHKSAPLQRRRFS